MFSGKGALWFHLKHILTKNRLCSNFFLRFSNLFSSLFFVRTKAMLSVFFISMSVLKTIIHFLFCVFCFRNILEGALDHREQCYMRWNVIRLSLHISFSNQSVISTVYQFNFWLRCAYLCSSYLLFKNLLHNKDTLVIFVLSIFVELYEFIRLKTIKCLILYLPYEKVKYWRKITRLLVLETENQFMTARIPSPTRM